LPIVFTNVADPVAAGLVASYARPRGNLTGFSNFEPTIGGKWVETLKDLDPSIRRVVMLFKPDTAPMGGKLFLPSFHAAGAKLQIETEEVAIHTAVDIKRAIDILARIPNAALVAAPDAFTGANRDLIIRTAENHRLPLIAAYRTFPDAGGLVSYGPDPVDAARQAVSYVDRILKGERPDDLPVQAPNRYELVINLRAAKALGLSIDGDFLLRVDEVIE
jgi:putative tryptophan/tyrosine transport system substrate-binding protein